MSGLPLAVEPKAFYTALNKLTLSEGSFFLPSFALYFSQW